MSFDLKGKAHTKGVGVSSFRSASRHSRHEDEKGAAIIVEMATVGGSVATTRRASAPASAVKMLLYAAATANEELVTRALKSGAHINDVDGGPDESEFVDETTANEKKEKEERTQGNAEEKKDDGTGAPEEKSIAKEKGQENEEEKKSSAKAENEEKSGSVYQSYVYTGDAAIHRAAAAGHASMIKFLWINNADLEVKNRIGSTALHRAVSNNQLDAVVQLLDLQARVDAANNIGNTPLHCAVYNGNVEIARRLVDGGAWTTLNCANKANMTPLHYARKRPIIQLLEQYLKQYHLAAASFSRLPAHLLKDLHGSLPASSFHAAHSFHKSKPTSSAAATTGSAHALPPLAHTHPAAVAISVLPEEKTSAASSSSPPAGSSSATTHSFSKQKKKVTLAAETIIKEEDEEAANDAV